MSLSTAVRYAGRLPVSFLIQGVVEFFSHARISAGIDWDTFRNFLIITGGPGYSSLVHNCVNGVPVELFSSLFLFITLH
jgi:hypothetical protein